MDNMVIFYVSNRLYKRDESLANQLYFKYNVVVLYRCGLPLTILLNGKIGYCLWFNIRHIPNEPKQCWRGRPRRWHHRKTKPNSIYVYASMLTLTDKMGLFSKSYLPTFCQNVASAQSHRLH